MKKHTLKLERSDVLCDLCNEYHVFVRCPDCNYDIVDYFEFRTEHVIDCGKCCLEFVVWHVDNTMVELVECEYIWRKQYDKATCEEDERFELACMPNSIDECACLEAQCPLVKAEIGEVYGEKKNGETIPAIRGP